MRTKEIRPWLEPEACAVCGRRLLQGEQLTWFITPDAQRRAVCELCVARADRANWTRERDGEQPIAMRPASPRRAGLIRRVTNWFAGADRGADDLTPPEVAAELEPDAESVAESLERPRRQSRLPRIESAPEPRRSRPQPEVPAPPRARNVTAVPTAEEAKLQRGLQLFNESQFPRTVAGLTRSLGLPQVAVLHAGGNSVELFVAWGISWYSYRVDLGDATEPVEMSGRGNDSAELDDVVGEWNVIADGGGLLMLKPGDGESRDSGEEPEPPAQEAKVGGGDDQAGVPHGDAE